MFRPPLNPSRGRTDPERHSPNCELPDLRSLRLPSRANPWPSIARTSATASQNARSLWCMAWAQPLRQLSCGVIRVQARFLRAKSKEGSRYFKCPLHPLSAAGGTDRGNCRCRPFDSCDPPRSLADRILQDSGVPAADRVQSRLKSSRLPNGCKRSRTRACGETLVAAIATGNGSGTDRSYGIGQMISQPSKMA
jgi:hypothetical protein